MNTECLSDCVECQSYQLADSSMVHIKERIWTTIKNQTKEICLSCDDIPEEIIKLIFEEVLYIEIVQKHLIPKLKSYYNKDRLKKYLLGFSEQIDIMIYRLYYNWH